MTRHNVFKRTLAGILAVLTVAGYIPANVGTGGIFSRMAIVASANETQSTNLTLSNLGDTIVTDSDGTEITDTSALTVGTYYIYTNKSIADSDVTEALSMGYKKNQTYNGTKYQYRYEIEVPEVPEDGYVLSHTNNWVGKVETSNTSVLLIGEDGVFGNIGAELKGEGTYYYGDQPSADSVQITDGFESVVSVGEVYFAQANGTKVETPEIGKSYYLTAEVFVDKSAEIEDPNEDTSVFYLKQKVNYVKRPLEKCEVYLKNGDEETKLTVKDGAVTVPANTFTYNKEAQKPEIIIKNNVLGTETILTDADYDADALKAQTDAGNYSAELIAVDWRCKLYRFFNRQLEHCKGNSYCHSRACRKYHL